MLIVALLLLQDEPVQAIFQKHCLECHSAKKVKGGLRMDSFDALLAGGDSGPALVPGHPEMSLLVKAIHGADPDTVTPMPYKKTLLPPADRQLIEQWIRAANRTGAFAAKGGDFGPELLRRKSITPALSPLRDIPPAPIDAFINDKLKAAGLTAAPPADLDTLLRRLAFDLTGLPPRDLPRDVEKAVDLLLASPQFGETWARHWMDLLRYAESRGHEFDYPIPNAWRYRDWLVRAFNDDVPWPRLVREHIAGDLTGNPVATAWWYFGEWLHSPVDIRGDEMERVANQVEVFAKGFLGLTVNCARCHDHKFDAISQKDFYALAGYLKSSAYRQVRLSLDEDRKIAAELDALRPPPLALATEPLEVLYEFKGPLMQDGVAFRAARPGDANLDYYLPRHAAVYDPAWPKQTVRTPQFTLEKETLWYLVRGAGSAFAEVDGHRMLEGPLHKATKVSWKDAGLRWHAHRLKDYVGPTHHVRIEFTPAGDDFAVFAVANADQAPPLPKMLDAKPPAVDAEKRKAVVAKIQDSPTAPAILDGPPAAEQLLIRGNPRTPSGSVPIRFLEALGAEEGGRRELAEKVVASPLAARVAVNRVWHHLFGRGLVPSVDDFGQMGLPASHPELLDRLAADFQADPSYKRLIRRLVLSEAYRRGPGVPSEKDPTNALLAVRPARRLSAEALRDAMLSASGRLDLTMGGAPVPVHLDGFQDGRGKPEAGPLDGGGRRSIYLAVRRNFLDTMLLAFDFPQPFGPMGRRNVSNVPAQALVLRNHPFVHQQAALWAKRDPSIADMWRAAFFRPPTAAEEVAAQEFLQGASKADLAHALFQAKEFIFIR